MSDSYPHVTNLFAVHSQALLVSVWIIHHRHHHAFIQSLFGHILIDFFWSTPTLQCTLYCWFGGSDCNSWAIIINSLVLTCIHISLVRTIQYTELLQGSYWMLVYLWNVCRLYRQELDRCQDILDGGSGMLGVRMCTFVYDCHMQLLLLHIYIIILLYTLLRYLCCIVFSWRIIASTSVQQCTWYTLFRMCTFVLFTSCAELIWRTWLHRASALSHMYTTDRVYYLHWEVQYTPKWSVRRGPDSDWTGPDFTPLSPFLSGRLVPDHVRTWTIPE